MKYLCLPFVSTKHIKANGKWVLEALIQVTVYMEFRACFTVAMYENDTSLWKTINVFIGAFLLFQNT